MTTNTIEVTKLSKNFRAAGQIVRALDTISLTVKEGSTLAIVGESGSGKTTAARLVLGLDQPSAGTVKVLDHDINAITSSELRLLRKDIQVVLQDPFSQLNRRHNVKRIIEGPLLAFKIGDRAARERKVLELVAAVGLAPEHLKRRPHELSGGQCQRVAIARALALDPKILILDEAVSALDVSVRAQVLNLLKSLQADRKLTYLFITHDLGVAHYMADEIAVMFRGKIVERGTRAEVFGSPRHHYTAGLLASVPLTDFSAKPNDAELVLHENPNIADACAYRTRCAVGKTQPKCADEALVEDMASPTHRWTCHFPIQR